MSRLGDEQPSCNPASMATRIIDSVDIDPHRCA